MKRIIRNLPEIFFIGFGTAWVIGDYLTTSHQNYVAVLIVWLLFLQLVYKNRLAGIVYGNVLALSSILAIGLLFIQQPDELAASTFKFVLAIALLAVAAFMGFKMLFKYLATDKRYADNEFTVSF